MAQGHLEKGQNISLMQAEPLGAREKRPTAHKSCEFDTTKKKLCVDACKKTKKEKATSRLVMDHTGKVLDSKLGLVAVFGRDVV